MAFRLAAKYLLLIFMLEINLASSAFGQKAIQSGPQDASGSKAELQSLIGDLQSAESKLTNDGVYQLTQPPTQSDIQKKNYAKAQRTSPIDPSTESGLVIVGEPESLKEAAAIAKRVADIQNRDRELKAKIASIQDRLAEKYSGVVNLDLSATTRELKGEKNSNSGNVPALGFVELSASLNGLPLIHYLQPSRLEQSDALPLYAGPLPPGEFEFKVSAMLGQLQHGWPYALAQGKWWIEKKFRIVIDGKKKAARWQIVATPSGPNGVPELALEEIREVAK